MSALCWNATAFDPSVVKGKFMIHVPLERLNELLAETSVKRLWPNTSTDLSELRET